MNKTNFKLSLLGLLFVFLVISCDKEENPKAIVRVMETIDSVSVPAEHVLVEVGPPTQEEVLEDVVAEGYTNSDGYIKFEFDKELVLRAVATRYELDAQGNPILDDDGNPIRESTGYKTIVLKKDYTDSRVIELR